MNNMSIITPEEHYKIILNKQSQNENEFKQIMNIPLENKADIQDEITQFRNLNKNRSSISNIGINGNVDVVKRNSKIEGLGQMNMSEIKLNEDDIGVVNTEKSQVSNTSSTSNPNRNKFNILDVQDVGIYNTEGVRSNPDEDYYQNNQNFMLEEDPKLKKVKFVLDDNDALEVEMQDQIDANNIEMIQKLYGVQKKKTATEGIAKDANVDIGKLQKPVFVDINEKIKKIENIQENNVNEFKSTINKNKNSENEKRVSFQQQLNHHLSKVKIEKVNNKTKKNDKETTENLIQIKEEDNFNSQDREIPNDSFYEKENEEEVVPEDDQKLEFEAIEDPELVRQMRKEREKKRSEIFNQI